MSALPPLSTRPPVQPPASGAKNPGEFSFATPAGFQQPNTRLSTSASGLQGRKTTSSVDLPGRSHTPLTLLNRDAANKAAVCSSSRADGMTPRSSPIRQRATVMFDTEDGGQFVVSYDAPQVNY